jgi:hypothetical protein
VTLAFLKKIGARDTESSKRWACGGHADTMLQKDEAADVFAGNSFQLYSNVLAAD